MPDQKYIQELYTEMNQWIHSLKFYEDDLKVLGKRLGEVSVKNTDSGMHALTERFQNKMILQKDHIDNLLHEIRAEQNILKDNIEQNPTASDHRKVKDLPELRDKVNTFELLFNDMRRDLIAFTSRWM